MLRVLHWSIAFSIVMAYSTAYYRYWCTTQMEVANWYLLVIHINFGLLILILSTIMLALRFQMAKTNNDTASTKKLSAKIVHFILYFMLFSLPVSAYIGTGFDMLLLGIFVLPSFLDMNSFNN